MRPILPKNPKPHEERQFVVPNTPPTREHTTDAFQFSVPRASSESSNSAAGEAATRPKAKRQVVSNACVPCRKRRSKCDGRQPCSKCVSLDKAAECHFDAENDHRRKGALRKENEDLKRKNAHLDVILNSLATSEPDQVETIVKRLKRGENFEDIANTLRPSKQRRTNPAPSDASSDTTQSDGYRSGDTERDESPSMGVLSNPSSWTNVTDDDEFVMELIELYFTWQHPYFLYFDERRFRADFARGSTENCSSLLVNAILATGCHFSDRIEARQDPNDEDSKGEHFVREAKELLEKEKRRPLTTLQALPVLAVRESGCGRDLRGRMYMSLAYRLICDPTYNPLTREPFPEQGIDEEAWRITFWGWYCLETKWCFGLGNQCEDNILARRISKPTATDATELAPWVPYTGGKKDLTNAKPCLIYTCMNEMIKLCEIIQVMTRWLYGPKLFKAGTLLELYAKLREWQWELPENIRTVDKDQICMVFLLHEFHRVAVLALFRPFFALPFEPAKDFLCPRELASIAAREEADLLRLHQATWGFRRTTNMIYQYLIPLATFRQMEFPHPNAVRDYVFAVKAMKETAAAWPFAKLALLSMVNVTDVPEGSKKPDGEIQNILNLFDNLSVEEQTEISKDSDYYRIIVETNRRKFAPEFEWHWRHEWTKYIAGLRNEEAVHGRLVKKPSISSLLNDA